MGAPSNLQRMANIMKDEKEIFWIDKKHLSEDERQRQGIAHTAELNLVLRVPDPLAPTDLGVSSSRRRPKGRPSNITIPGQTFSASTCPVMLSAVPASLLKADIGIG